MNCPKCNAPDPGDYCERCEEIEDLLDAALPICRSDQCLNYECLDGQDRCLLLPRPCRLKERLTGGWKCPMGYHSELDG